jgi:hypothetical protein
MITTEKNLNMFIACTLPTARGPSLPSFLLSHDQPTALVFADLEFIDRGGFGCCLIRRVDDAEVVRT